MRKYFGTDGIRRIANTELTPELVYRVAKAGAYVLSKHTDHAPTILIGRDTRISGTLIEAALTSGFLSYGANVKLVGVIPTPAIAHLTRTLNADAGVVISASHNTYEFNGIKYFSNLGTKIADEIEEEIEEIMDSPERLNELTAAHHKIGVSEIATELSTEYVQFFTNTFVNDFSKYDKSNFKVVLDTANGATYQVAEEIFKKLEINYTIINNSPDGININHNCGSTHLEPLGQYVVANKYDLGIAFDGDGDRCLCVDRFGNTIDGDMMIAIVAKYLKQKNELDNSAMVTTVMSNLGLSKFAKENDITLVQTKVGDRYVLEEMLKSKYIIGGEQSGHVIFLKHNPTGDGILTACMLIKVILEKNICASELAKEITIYPQVLINAKVNSDKKYDYENDTTINEEIKKLEKEFSGNGRVLIRPSGTEPLVRVMIEGEDLEYITSKAKNIANLIEERLK